MTNPPPGNDWTHQQATLAPIDTSFQWDGAGCPPNATINYYEDLLQNVNQCYSTLDHSLAGLSLSNPESSHAATPEPPHNSADVVCLATPSSADRRRLQNRMSQRAYRERKERREKELQDQVTQWRLQYHSLCVLHAERTAEIVELQSRVESLAEEISRLHFAVRTLGDCVFPRPQEFNLGPCSTAPGV